MKTDAELLRLARDDADAFAELARRYVAELDAWFRRRSPDAATAADLTAETMAQAWLARLRFRDEAGGSAAPWLYGIARNLLRRYERRRRVETAARARLGMPLRDAAAEDAFVAVDERLAAAAVSSRLQRALRRLSSEQRDALELRVVEGLAYGEVARRAGCSEPAARLRVSRALRSLRGRLQGVKA